LRRNETGIIILAGNAWPIDIYSHLPAICEEKDIPYIFTPSRQQLGLVTGHKRAAIVVLIREHESYSELFQEVRNMIATTAPLV
uniref:Ribosomal_L7Ae domain-containing protein n=1 Tax=Gongylonema pulchrum TaxID=637853 RepID=A0A183CZS3_9BILA